MALTISDINTMIRKLLKRPELVAELIFSSISILTFSFIGVLVAVISGHKWQGLFLMESPAPDEWVYFLAWILFALASLLVSALPLVMAIESYKQVGKLRD